MPVTANDPAGARTVLLAAPRSFCAGVEHVIAIVEQLLDQRGGPIYVRKQIVHNTHVVTVKMPGTARKPAGSTVAQCRRSPSVDGRPVGGDAL